MSEVIIYNLGGTEELGRVTVKHAVTMLHRRVAQVREAIEGERLGPYPRPRSVELVRYVFAKWRYVRTGRVQLSRAAILRRDRYRCAYCPRPGTPLDHIVPKCQGGETSWPNVPPAVRRHAVNACFVLAAWPNRCVQAVERHMPEPSLPEVRRLALVAPSKTPVIPSRL